MYKNRGVVVGKVLDTNGKKAKFATIGINRIISMKNLSMLFLIFVVAVPIVSGQMRKSNVKQSNTPTTNANWSEIVVGKGGIKSLRLPTTLIEEKDNEEKDNKDYDKIWKNTSANLNVNVSEVTISVTIWNEGFKVPDLKPELATPENLLAIDLMADMKNTSGNRKAEYYKVDGINGELVQRKWKTNKGNQTMFIWATYRYYLKTKAERIMITVIVPPTKPQNAMKIIDSLKFEQSND